jgi:hypothetical protein
MRKVHDTRDFRAKKFAGSNNFSVRTLLPFSSLSVYHGKRKGMDKVVVQPYQLLVEASESFEKAELAAKEAPTDVLELLERAAMAPSRKTAIPIGARENPDGSESNQDEGATKQYRVTSSVLDEPWCVHHGAMVSWFV